MPLIFAEQGVDEIILRLLRLEAAPRDLDRWTAMVDRLKNPAGEVAHRAGGQVRRVRGLLQEPERGPAARRPGPQREGQHRLDRVREAARAPAAERSSSAYDGILVPGGFGKRGIEGMIQAIRYARESKVPYFGICLGMQTMVIEFARNVCGLEQRRLDRVRPGRAPPVIYKLRELKGVDELGGTMRLGAYPCQLAEGSFAHRAYGAREISERHRHRYEFNREYEQIARPPHGLRITGRRRRTASTSRSARSRTIPGSWAASSTPSSSPSRSSRTRCSGPSSARRYEHRAASRAVSEAGRGRAVTMPVELSAPERRSNPVRRRRARWRSSPGRA